MDHSTAFISEFMRTENMAIISNALAYLKLNPYLPESDRNQIESIQLLIGGNLPSDIESSRLIVAEKVEHTVTIPKLFHTQCAKLEKLFNDSPLSRSLDGSGELIRHAENVTNEFSHFACRTCGKIFVVSGSMPQSNQVPILEPISKNQ